MQKLRDNINYDILPAQEDLELLEKYGLDRDQESNSQILFKLVYPDGKYYCDTCQVRKPLAPIQGTNVYRTGCGHIKSLPAATIGTPFYRLGGIPMAWQFITLRELRRNKEISDVDLGLIIGCTASTAKRMKEKLLPAINWEQNITEVPAYLPTQIELEFLQKYGLEEDRIACLQLLIRKLYPDLICPKCKSQMRPTYVEHNKEGKNLGSNNFRTNCKCKTQFSPLQGTIFQNSPIPIWKWFKALKILRLNPEMTPRNLREALHISAGSSRKIHRTLLPIIDLKAYKKHLTATPGRVEPVRIACIPENYLPTLSELEALRANGQIDDERACMQLLWSKTVGDTKKAYCEKCHCMRGFHITRHGQRSNGSIKIVFLCNRNGSRPRCTHIYPYRKGTIFYNSNLPLHTWFKILYELRQSEDPSKVSTIYLARVTGCFASSAWKARNKLVPLLEAENASLLT